MKKLICIAGIGAVAALAALTASGQTNAFDNAAAYSTWADGSNSGFGFRPWILRHNNGESGTGNGGFAGFFIGGTGTAIDTVGKSFGMYANGDGVNYAVAYRTFSNALPANYVFTTKFKNAFLDPDSFAGFCLRSSDSTNFTSTDLVIDPDTRFSFYFPGGGANYVIWDAAGATDTGIPYTGGGQTIEFYLLSPDTYRLIVKSADGLTTITNFDGLTLAGNPGAAITNYTGFCFDTGQNGDVHFNSFQISSVSLVPPVIADVSPANGAAYVSSATPIAFTVSSTFSGVPSANISLLLNGTNVSGLNFSGSNGFWNVTKSGALSDNRVYAAQIIATDINGNKATNNFTFNTWTADNFFIEAEAYNYSGGGYVPSPGPGTYDAIIAAGVNGVDFLETDDPGTNGYRTQDAVDLERSGDSLDHANYNLFGLENWALSWVQPGEWLNYTRRTSNVTYNVYARMSGGGNQPVMLMERLADSTAASSNQPLAALGTFVAPNTGDIVSNYTFVPLRDFFSSDVAVRFSTSSLTTNTFRLTRIGDGYNLDYLIFVPSTVTGPLRPYLAAGFPFPGAANVSPDQTISFTIANRQTTVAPASIQLFVNNVNVTSAITTSNNTAGTVVSCAPTELYPTGTNTTVSVVFTDSASVTQTNTWQFSVANVPVIPASYAIPASGVNRGFNVHVVKAPNEAPAEQFPTSSERAEAHLAGSITNTLTGQPWTNEAAGPFGNGRYAETNVINYNQVIEFGSAGTFGNDSLFPNVAPTLEGSYTNDPNNFSMEAIAFAQLEPGIYRWAVRSDDGFRLTFGTGANPTNLIVGEFEGARSDVDASEFQFIVQTNGLYPFRLLYYEGDGFANVELYSINRTNGQATLLNDLEGNSIVTYRDVPVILLNPSHSGNNTTFSFATQLGRTHTIEYKNALTNGAWQTLRVVSGTGAITNIIDSAATNASRFYRISTQ